MTFKEKKCIFLIKKTYRTVEPLFLIMNCLDKGIFLVMQMRETYLCSAFYDSYTLAFIQHMLKEVLIYSSV